MKRIFLRSLAVLMIACLFISTVSGVTVKEKSETFTEIVIVDIDDAQKEQQIIATLNGDNLISPMNLLCIFGHSISQGTAIETNHRYWATAPRCRQTTYRVDYCTRSGCDYMKLTQTSQVAIRCCA